MQLLTIAQRSSLNFLLGKSGDQPKALPGVAQISGKGRKEGGEIIQKELRAVFELL